MTALTQQSFIDAISVPGVKIVGDGNTNPDWMQPRYGEAATISSSVRLDPGTPELSSGGLAASGFGPWAEVSSLSLANPGVAKIGWSSVMYSLSKATKQWTARVRWGGDLGFASHAFAWGGEWGTFKEGTAPTGWGDVDQNGVRFMDAKSTWLGSNDRVRAHCWPMSWTGVNGFFWPSVNPNSPTGLADRAKLADIAALVSIMDFTVTGANAAQAQYAVSQGWDVYPETANVTNPPLRAGSGSGFRAVANGTTTICSTMDRGQVAAYAPALVAIHQPGSVITPPADVKRKVRTCLEVDGVQSWTPIVAV